MVVLECHLLVVRAEFAYYVPLSWMVHQIRGVVQRIIAWFPTFSTVAGKMVAVTCISNVLKAHQ